MLSDILNAMRGQKTHPLHIIVLKRNAGIGAVKFQQTIKNENGSG